MCFFLLSHFILPASCFVNSSFFVVIFSIFLLLVPQFSKDSKLRRISIHFKKILIWCRRSFGLEKKKNREKNIEKGDRHNSFTNRKCIVKSLMHLNLKWNSTIHHRTNFFISPCFVHSCCLLCTTVIYEIIVVSSERLMKNCMHLKWIKVNCALKHDTQKRAGNGEGAGE